MACAYSSVWLLACISFSRACCVLKALSKLPLAKFLKMSSINWVAEVLTLLSKGATVVPDALCVTAGMRAIKSRDAKSRCDNFFIMSMLQCFSLNRHNQHG